MSLLLGERIKEARKAAGLTQRQLADKLNVSNTSISNWEKSVSMPDPDTIQHLCWALNVQPNFFFGADQLGAMLGNEKSATQEDDGLSEMVEIFTALSPDNRSKLLELSRLYLNAQHNSGEKK